jgi:hypothetical protein
MWKWMTLELQAFSLQLNLHQCRNVVALSQEENL